jgi:hypothetical protein
MSEQTENQEGMLNASKQPARPFYFLLQAKLVSQSIINKSMPPCGGSSPKLTSTLFVMVHVIQWTSWVC